MRKTPVVLVCCLLFQHVARAEEEAAPPTVSVGPAAADLPEVAPTAALPPVADAGRFTPQQLDILARIAKAPRSVVLARLDESAKLREDARRALASNTSRRSKGKTQAIAGFTVVGLGDIVMAYYYAGAMKHSMADGLWETDQEHSRRMSALDRDYAGMAAGIVIVGIGAAIGVPGLLSYARRGPDELAFADEVADRDLPAPGDPATAPPRLDMPPDRREEPVTQAPALMFPIAFVEF